MRITSGCVNIKWSITNFYLLIDLFVFEHSAHFCHQCVSVNVHLHCKVLWVVGKVPCRQSVYSQHTVKKGLRFLFSCLNSDSKTKSRRPLKPCGWRGSKYGSWLGTNTRQLLALACPVATFTEPWTSWNWCSNVLIMSVLNSSAFWPGGECSTHAVSFYIRHNT